jgi:hypothetical protein
MAARGLADGTVGFEGVGSGGVGAGGETGTQRGGDSAAETDLEEAGADVSPGSPRARPGEAQDLRAA